MAHKITPFLLMVKKAKAAAKFYKSVFKNECKILYVSPLGASIQIRKLNFILCDNGPICEFSPSISFYLECKTQKEIDSLWRKLSAGGKIRNCGWVQDKFGVWWQVVPSILGELLHSHQKEMGGRVMAALVKMKKIEIEKLKKAHAGK